MAEMKYVVVKSSECGEELFICPANVNHDAFAETLSYIKHYGPRGGWNRVYREPIAAGFTDGKTCYGRSETLNLASRPEDTQLLNKGGKQ